MFRNTLRMMPLVNQQGMRGMSTASDIRVKLDSFARNELVTMLKYARVELTPPTPAELPRAIRDGIRLFRHPSAWKNVTIREAWQNTLVTIEVVCWFFVGECIGKGTLVGYQV